jgi:hypothetical protein
MSRNTETFATVRVEGSILPVDLLQRIAAGDARLSGLRPEDYRLAGEKINEATNRAWNRLLSAWDAFKAAAEKVPQSDPGDAVTLNKWLLPLWRTLEYGQLDPARPFEIDGKEYAISHLRYHSPIHLVGFRQDMDKRVETPEGKRPSPHGLVQEFLNRSEAHMWGFVSNGLKLRVLRDNIRLTRQAFVEFDLQAMLDGKVYSDFALLWRLCHESRVHAEKPEQCWLEKWSKAAAEQGLRALDQLRGGVENAIEALGRGFLHPANAALLQKLRSGTLPAMDYYRQLLRVVYRLLFLFVAEDRELLFDPAASEPASDRYLRFYSTARLRRLAERLRGTQHTDLYQGLDLVLTRLGTMGCTELGLPALGGLFDPAGTSDLTGCRISNADLLEAVRALAVVSDGRSLRPVDYRNLGSEELGSVYESLLELHPQFTPDPPAFVLKSASGNERKTTGSYYTPTSLITCLLDSALDPVLDEAAAKPDPEKAILDLKVCDPACGSGHFLIAAAHRIAKRLASVRTQEEEPAPDAVRHALREVIGRCIFGVDINPMAVELCQVALWMEALEPGKPLSFLDHHVRCGNSLVGVARIGEVSEIPDRAFEPAGKDDKQVARSMRRQNSAERQGQGYLPFSQNQEISSLAEASRQLRDMPDSTHVQVKAMSDAYLQLRRPGTPWERERKVCDLWTSAFLVDLNPVAAKNGCIPTSADFVKLLQSGDINRTLAPMVTDLAKQHLFFHWPLEFPEVFATGGFDAVLGNPPYDVVRENRLLRSTSARGTSNLFGHFVARGVILLAQGGALGLVVPLSLACGDDFEGVRRELFRSFGTVRTSHYSIRPAKLFPHIDQRITLLTALSRGDSPCEVFSTRLHRWNPGEEEQVLGGAEFGQVGRMHEGIIPKLAGRVGASIYAKLLAQPGTFRDWTGQHSDDPDIVYYHAIARYWIKGYSFLPYFQRKGEPPGVSTNVCAVPLPDREAGLRFLLLVNSSLFYYWWMTQSDEFHVLESEVLGFPIPSWEARWPERLVIEPLIDELMSAYSRTAVRRERSFRGKPVSYDEFRPRQCLSGIQAIDAVVGPIYGLTEEEQSFLASYDMQFRTDDDEK